METGLPSTEIPQGRIIALGFDEVFGPSGQTLISRLSAGATYVAYGFLGGPRAGVVSSITQLIVLKKMIFKGFRYSTALATLSKREEMAFYSLSFRDFVQASL